MPPFADYPQYDGLALAELVRTRQVAPAELVEAAIARIEDHNPALNAIVVKMYDQARAVARAPLPAGPFMGVPLLLKDFWSVCAGVPTSAGNRLLRAIPRGYDSELVRRYRASGAIILGKTNTPEFALLPSTEPETFGPTRNPWDLSRTPGGSSGGSAAAVAARMTPLAGATDGGGSIRMPASCCGLFGMKVSRGRTPVGPFQSEMWRGLGVEHVITRSVRDSAAMLDATAGPEAGGPYIAPPPVRPFLEEVTTPPGRLRIAFTDQPFFGGVVHPDCRRGLLATASLLEQLGHTLVEDAPRIDGEACAIALMHVVAGEAWSEICEAARLAGRRPAPADFDVVTYGFGMIGVGISVETYVGAWRMLQRMARDIGRFFERYDVLLTPTLAQPPVLIGHFAPAPAERAILQLVGWLNAGWLLQALNVVGPLAAKVYGFMAYTPLFNITGQPAMSAPLYWNDAGLPIGMQFAGRYGDEATLFRLAGQLEAARPWSDQQLGALGVGRSDGGISHIQLMQ